MYNVSKLTVNKYVKRCAIRMFSSDVDKSLVIRDSSTIVVLRDHLTTNPKILMGQRGSGAAFMPNKFVFPGGAVDFEDATVPCFGELSSLCHDRLLKESDVDSKTLALTAIRELWEETGQIIGSKEGGEKSQDVTDNINHSSWKSFISNGFLPDISNLTFIFRAVTPLGRPRRFDARFFLIEAENLSSKDLDDFSKSDNELKHLQWIPLTKVTEYDLPFITQVVLAEIKNRLIVDENTNTSITLNKNTSFLPFFRDGDDVSKFKNVLHTGCQDLSEFKL